MVGFGAEDTRLFVVTKTGEYYCLDIDRTGPSIKQIAYDRCGWGWNGVGLGETMLFLSWGRLSCNSGVGMVAVGDMWRIGTAAGRTGCQDVHIWLQCYLVNPGLGPTLSDAASKAWQEKVQRL